MLWSKSIQGNAAVTEQSTGKIKALNVWTLQHHSSGLSNGVLSRHANSTERERERE